MGGVLPQLFGRKRYNEDGVGGMQRLYTCGGWIIKNWISLVVIILNIGAVWASLLMGLVWVFRDKMVNSR
jgi:hypothetical protein